MSEKSDTYQKSVFINCPFDDDYTDILHAITFAIYFAGFIPRSALETSNSAVERLGKIIKLIRECRLSVHDISRVEIAVTAPGDLPRFNMPFECGIFYGAINFGGYMHKSKELVVLDSEPYRYQKTMSDIAGKDPDSHSNSPKAAIACIRRFLVDKSNRLDMPGENHFVTKYEEFQVELPKILAAANLTSEEIRKYSYWRDYTILVKNWVDSKVPKSEGVNIAATH